MTAPYFGKKKRHRILPGPSVAHTYAMERVPPPGRATLPFAARPAASGFARRTAVAFASGITSCSLPVSTHSGCAPRSASARPSIAAMAAGAAVTSRVRGALACSVHRSPSAVTGTMPAIISSVTASPAPKRSRTTCALPSVGCPANGISNVGVNMRTRALPVARRRQCGPSRERRLAEQWRQRPQPLLERYRIHDEMRIVLLEQRDALRKRSPQRQCTTFAHACKERVWQLHGADAPAFGLDKHRSRGVERVQPLEQCTLERFLRRLRRAGQGAQQRSAVPREQLQVEGLRAGGFQ